jgi:hypothetical protein
MFSPLQGIWGLILKLPFKGAVNFRYKKRKKTVRVQTPFSSITSMFEIGLKT